MFNFVELYQINVSEPESQSDTEIRYILAISRKLEKYEHFSQVSEWVIKFNGLSGDGGVHIFNISRVIIAYTLESLFFLT